MTRSVCAAILVMTLAASAPSGCTPPAPAAPGLQAAIDKARQLNQQVEQLYREGRYHQAVVLAEQSLAIRENALGPAHPDVAESLNNLAALYATQVAYARAEPLYRRALAIRQKALGPDHRDVAETLNNLATFYYDQGAYAKAEPLYLRALQIYDGMHLPDEPSIARTSSNLAQIYRDQGAYVKAESLLLRALEIRERSLGPGDPAVAQSLNNLAAHYHGQGAYGKAEPCYLRAVAILEAADAAHPDFATALSNLATLYRDQGAYPDAERLYLRAIRILEKALGDEHPRVANSLNNLATLYREQGAYGKAEPLLARALEIRSTKLGAAHLDVANSLSSLATLYREQGAYGKAAPLSRRALAVREDVLGSDHPLVADSLNDLARLDWGQGEYGHAEALLARGAEIREHALRVELARLPEPRTRAIMALLQQETDRVVSFHADAAPDSASALALAFTTVLRRKGRVLDSLVDHETRLRNHLTPEVRGQLDQLADARAELVRRLYAPTGSQRAEARGAVAAVRARIDALESVLSAVSADFRSQVEPITWAKIQAALPPGAALVEFVRYRDSAPQQPRQRREERYLAYLLTSRGPPGYVALGAAARIDAEIEAVLAAVHGKAERSITRRALQRLDALVLAPIRARLSGTSQLVLAPDGQLNLVPFDALVDADGRYALENYLVSYVTTGRDLLRLATSPRPRTPAVIVAAPDYGSGPSTQDTVSFPALPGAAAEATDLQTYFSFALLTGRRATKSALAALAGPAMIHVATHGFYARDPEPPAAIAPARLVTAIWPAQGVARGMSVDGGGPLQPRLHSDELADALDRSGLALAGANQSADGIVTAREIAGFDWWGTELVVLSACDTGMGATSRGEGVYGLRRALVLAGAASQVVSLWSVDDAATRTLMRDYYGNLGRGMGRAEALRQAKLRALRRQHDDHPHDWAAFISAGDWRSLDSEIMQVSRR